LKYLGIPLSDTKLSKGAFTGLCEKVSKRIPPWKGKHTSLGGRLILSNNCLSSLPTYTMGFYSLPLGTHRKLDTIRSRFFWRGAEDNFKYHMVRWNAVCRAKEFGGLGILNTKIFNDCLITKWIWKTYTQSDRLWVRILKARFFKSSGLQGSQFWRRLSVLEKSPQSQALIQMGGNT
jgi:hypothetical protein